MGEINLGRVALGGLVAAVMFVVMESIVEGIALVIFGVSEKEMAAGVLAITDTGAQYHIINTSYLLVVCMLFVWVYAALRPKFGAGPKTALITCAVFLVTGALVAVNLVNTGIYPAKLLAASFLFNVLELPFAVLAGAAVYKEA